MRQALYQLLFSAMLLLPLHSIAQSFNHVYPSGGDRPGIFAEQTNGGFQFVANASPVGDGVSFKRIQTDNQGVQLAADSIFFDNTYPNDGRYNRLSNGTFAYVQSSNINGIKLTKIAADGTPLWTQVYQLPLNNEVSHGVVVEGNGGELFIYGHMTHWLTHFGQFYVIKAAADGQQIWAKTFSLYDNNETYLPAVEGGAATADGGFVLVANSQNQVKFFLRFDVDGNHELITSVNSFINNSTLVVEGSPGAAVFAYGEATGVFGSFNVEAKFAQYNVNTGELDWETQLQPFNPPISPQQSYITALAKTSDGGFLVAGNGKSASNPERLFLAKVDGSGQVVWNNHDYGFTAEVAFVQETATGGILVSGRQDGLAWLMLTDALGNVICTASNTISSIEICEGESFEFGGQMLAESGTYTHLYQSQGPCDSFATITLLVHPLDTKHYYETLCLGEVSNLNGEQYLQAGYFEDTISYQNIDGCDSIVINHVQVETTILIEGWAWVPYGEEFLGQIITQSGWYGASDTSEFGCITISVFEVHCIYGAASDKLSEQIGLNVAPNPFCKEAQLRFKLPTSATVSASVFDAQSRRKTTLLTDEKLPPGEQQLTIRTEDWPPGIYFLQIMVDGQIGSRRLLKGCR